MDWCPKCQKTVNTNARKQRSKVKMTRFLVEHTIKECEECRQILTFQTRMIDQEERRSDGNVSNRSA